MQKIKYIIILILTLGLISLYVQLTDYNEISHSLLQENSSVYQKVESLEQQVMKLEDTNQDLREQIAIQDEKIESQKETIKILQTQLVRLQLHTQIIEKKDHSIPTDFHHTLPSFEKNEEKFNFPAITPSILLDQENKEIQKIQLQYQQNF